MEPDGLSSNTVIVVDSSPEKSTVQETLNIIDSDIDDDKNTKTSVKPKKLLSHRIV